jgi:hypothetical protein
VSDNTSEIIFSRQQSAYIKGVAVVMLILHHLFLFPSANPWFTSIVGNNWGGVEFFFSSVGKLCIPLFFFVSGFGLWHASVRDRRLWKSSFRRLRSIYTIYVVTAAVTVLLLYAWNGIMPLLSWRHAVETFLGVNVSINGSWWFFIIYVELLLLTPLSVHFIRRFSWQSLLVLSFVVYLLSPESGFTFFSQRLKEIGLGPLLYNPFPISLFWLNQIYFYTGFCLAASGLFEAALDRTLHGLRSSRHRYGIGLLVVVGVLTLRYCIVDMGEYLGLFSRQGMDIFTYTLINIRADFILGPLFIYGLILLFYGHSMPRLRFMGNNSATIWLIHGSVVYIVISVLTPYRPWSPLAFLAVLIVSSLYALVYLVIQQRLIGFFSRMKKSS